jgi:hypothetical protein
MLGCERRVRKLKIIIEQIYYLMCTGCRRPPYGGMTEYDAEAPEPLGDVVQGKRGV